MRIAVCMKQVPVSEQVAIDPVTGNLMRANSEGQVNPADLNALQCACTLREQTGGSVTAITMGPPDFAQTLRTALAMGADEGVLCSDPRAAGSDTVATARVLAAVLRHLGGFDLVLFGNESADGATGQVGPMTAELLGLPHCTELTEIQPETAGQVLVVKRDKNRKVRLRMALPGAGTVCFGCNEPTLPTLFSQMEAEEKELLSLSLDDLDLAPEETGGIGSPTRVTACFSQERGRKATMLPGSPAEQAAAILSLIQTGLEGSV